MSQETSEEKSLPASKKKLKDSRKRGQAPQSRDLRVGATTAVVVGYLLFSWPTIRDQAIQLINVVAAASAQPFEEVWRRSLALSQDILLDTTLPLVAVVAVASIIAGVAGTFGPVFSFETIKPNFDHINPASGLKRLFSIRNVVEFLKSLVKVVAVAATLWFVLRVALQPLFQTPLCGDGCVLPVFLLFLKTMAIAAVLIFLVIGALDLFLQRQLFLRDMRMTKSESKRERKDQEGAPEIRQARRRAQRDAANMPRLGVRHAVLVIASGDRMVGLRYNRLDTPVPAVVCRGSGERGRQLLAEARSLGVPVETDHALTSALEAGLVGDRIDRALFNPVANALVRYGLI